MNNINNSDEQIVLMLDHMSIAPGNTYNLMKKCLDLQINRIKSERQNLPGWKGIFYKVRDRITDILFPFSDTKAASKHIEEIIKKRYKDMKIKGRS